MIVSIGEALIDYKNGRHFFGGCPLNVSLTIARQNVGVSFLGGISDDENGKSILNFIIDNCILFDPVFCSCEKRTMTANAIVKNGSVEYEFDWKNTSAFEIDGKKLDVAFSANTDIDAVFFGSVAFSDLKVGSEIISFLADKPEVIKFFDANIRPFVIENMEEYRNRLDEVCPLCPIVKVSEEDLALWNRTEDEVFALCNNHLIVTRGDKGATWYSKSLKKRIDVESFPVENVVDTIGCGDVFSGTILAEFEKPGRFRDFDNLTADEIETALKKAVKAAALNCAKEGCEPPTDFEIDD